MIAKNHEAATKNPASGSPQWMPDANAAVIGAEKPNNAAPTVLDFKVLALHGFSLSTFQQRLEAEIFLQSLLGIPLVQIERSPIVPVHC